MSQFGKHLRDVREGRGLLLRELAAAAHMDTGLLSKIERGERRARREQVVAFAIALKQAPPDFERLWLADQVYDLLKEEEDPSQILRVAEERIEYLKKKLSKQ